MNQHEQIERLLGQLAEMRTSGLEPTQHFGGRVRRRRRTLTPRVMFGAAAAIALCLPLVPPRTPASSESTPALLVEHMRTADPAAQKSAATFASCAERDAIALVVLRSWDDECQCLNWNVHRFADGRTLAELIGGEELRFEVDVDEAPAVEQLLVIAVSRHGARLPDDVDDAEALLSCLNDAAPPSLPDGISPEDEQEYASALQTCLAADVEVFHRPFYTD